MRSRVGATITKNVIAPAITFDGSWRATKPTRPAVGGAGASHGGQVSGRAVGGMGAGSAVVPIR
jgi:hypothetical protein